MPFTIWLAELLGQKEQDVQRLMDDSIALQFFIAWTLYESKCFHGFLKANDLRRKTNKFIEEGFSSACISSQLAHFHERYQDKKALDNLVQDEKTPAAVASDFSRCLASPPERLSPSDQVFVVAFVVNRYRNNMFHGSKGVQSWLEYKPQIGHCITAMQEFIKHSELAHPTLL